MRESDLTRDLATARDALTPADQIAGRHEVDRRVQKHQRQRIAVVMTVVVLLVGGGAFGLSRTGTEEQGLITTPDAGSGVPRIVPDHVPAGWWIDSSIDLGELAEASATSMAPVEIRLSATWIDSPSPRPEPGARVIVATAAAQEPDAASTDTVATGTADGIDVWISGDLGQASWRSGDLVWTLNSRGVDEQALRGAVGEIQGSAGGDVLPPQGFQELERRGPYEVLPMMRPDWAASPGPPSGYAYGFQPVAGSTAIDGATPDDGGTVSPGLMVMGGGRADPWITYVSGADPVARITVLGHPAQLWQLKGQACTAASSSDSSDGASESCTSSASGYSLTVDWTEDSTVSVYAATEDEVRRLAEGLREVDEATWREYIASLGSSSAGSASTTIPASEISGQGTEMDSETGEPVPTTAMVSSPTTSDPAPEPPG